MIEGNVRFRAWLENLEMPGSNEQMLYSDEIDLISFWSNCLSWQGKVHLMSYTGYNDKSGRPIYQGDIVQYKNLNFSMKGRVVLHKGCWMVRFENEDLVKLHVVATIGELNVIGNVFQDSLESILCG